MKRHFSSTRSKIDVSIYLLNRIGILLVAIYFISMFVYPSLGGEWSKVQKVWHDWQGLNVGILAFISSLIAFNISRYNADKQREREFIAARASLPQALSELSEYLTLCAGLLVEAWEAFNPGLDSSHFTPKSNLPEPSRYVNSVFSECIRHGEPNVAEHLAEILMHLQINDSRLRGLYKDMASDKVRTSRPEIVKDYLFYLAELQALVNGTYEFARNGGSFTKPVIDLDELTTAYLNLDIPMDKIDSLRAYTEKRLGIKNA